MSNDARRTTTIGEIVNLMSVDAERIMEVVQYLWMIWSSPLQICIAIYLLYGILGPAVFAGLAAILIMFPINSILASIEAKLQVSLLPISSIFNNFISTLVVIYGLGYCLQEFSIKISCIINLCFSSTIKF